VSILRLAVSERLLFSQMVSAILVAVPLWKVIAGLALAKTATGSARVRFSFSATIRA
jgi:hypothetical protein